MAAAPSIFNEIKWKRDSDVLGFMDRVLTDKETENASMERQAEINLAWYRGHQLLRWNRHTTQLQLQPNPHHRVRLVYNLMRGLLDGFAAKLALDPILLTVEPATDDITDYDTAELQTKVLRYYQDALGFDSLIDEADLFAMLTGESFVKVIWDPLAGDPIGYEDEGGQLPLPFRRQLEKEGVHIGDLSVKGVSIFNIFWGPTGTMFDEADYLTEIYDRPIATLMERYGLKADQIKPGGDGQIKVWRAGQTNVFGSAVRERSDDLAIVKTLWVKPNQAIRGLERGRHCIAIADNVVKNEPIPYDHQRIPFIRFAFQPIPGENRADTFTKDLIAPQANINRTVSQFAENRELMANPVWLARETAIVNENEWISRPGGIRTYRGEKPTLEEGSAMPNAVLMMLGHDLKFMQDIVGLRDVSMGKNPPGVRSGRGLSILKESDDERMSKIARRRRVFWQAIGNLILETAQQYVTEERRIRITGDEAESETVTFTGSQLLPESEGLGIKRFDVKVRSRGMPRSQSARIEALDRALERGALQPATDPRDKELVLDVLELGTRRDPLSYKRKARRLQHTRNLRMAKGKYTPPSVHEDLDTMLQELTEFRHEPFFERLSPELFDRYEEEAIGIMALKDVRIKRLIEAALKQAGELPPQGQQPSAPAPPQLPGGGA